MSTHSFMHGAVLLTHPDFVQKVTIKREIERKNKSGIPFTLRLQKRYIVVSGASTEFQCCSFWFPPSPASSRLSLCFRKDFGNPYHLSLIVDLKNIDEWGSNYPKGKFDPHCDAEYFVNKLSFAVREIRTDLMLSNFSLLLFCFWHGRELSYSDFPRCIPADSDESQPQ